LGNSYEALQEAGAEVAALAVATLPSVNRGVRAVLNPPFPLLADPDHEVAEAFNVYNLLGNGYAAPSVFVIDTDGSIVWSHVGRSSGDRPNVDAILEQIP
jgi:peroxiredoxin